MDKMVLKTAQTVFLPRDAQDMRQVRRVEVKPTVTALKAKGADCTLVEGQMEVSIRYYPALPGDCGPFTETVTVPLVAELRIPLPCQDQDAALAVRDVDWETISPRAIELQVVLELYCVPAGTGNLPDFRCQQGGRHHHEQCDLTKLMQAVDPVLPLADNIAVQAAERAAAENKAQKEAQAAAQAQKEAQAKAEAQAEQERMEAQAVQAQKEAQMRAEAQAKAAAEKMKAEAAAQAKAAAEAAAAQAKAEAAQAEAEARMKAQAEEAACAARAAQEEEAALQAAKAAAAAQAQAAQEAQQAAREAAEAQQIAKECPCQQEAETLLAPGPDTKIAVCAGVSVNPAQRITQIATGKDNDRGGRYCLKFQIGAKDEQAPATDTAALDAMDACYYEE